MADTIPAPVGGPAGSPLRQRFAAALATPLSSPPPVPPYAPSAGSAASVPGEVLPAGPGLAGVMPVGFQVIAELRGKVASLLASETAEQVLLSEDDRRQRGFALVRSTVASWATDYAAAASPLTREQEGLVRQAVFNDLFRAGRLQPLLDDPGIENILIDGYDDVSVDYLDRPAAKVAPLTGSDAELVALVNQLARTQGVGERSLSPSTPTLNLRLADGSRLAASYLVTDRPHVVIRKHRMKQTRLAELVDWGTIDPALEKFLRALVLARKNVFVVGSQGVGKTSLLRAMAREIPAGERVGTLESEYELWLHELDGGPKVIPFEAREGNGEKNPDGSAAGEITLADLFPQLLRMSLRRIIVGEVRSVEVVPMLHAMNEGEGGSMCTLHARSATSAIERIVTLCLESGIGMSETLAYRLLAQAIDVVVYLRLVDETAIGGRKHRFVSHVVEITGLGEGGRPALQTVFGPRDQGGRREPRAVPQLTPACIEDLMRVGYDRTWFQHPFGAWRAPLTTVRPL